MDIKTYSSPPSLGSSGSYNLENPTALTFSFPIFIGQVGRYPPAATYLHGWMFTSSLQR